MFLQLGWSVIPAVKKKIQCVILCNNPWFCVLEGFRSEDDAASLSARAFRAVAPENNASAGGKKKTIMGYQKLHHLKGVCTRCCGVAGFRVSVGYISLSDSCVLYLGI